MFDFIKPERHNFLKKVLGIGTLFGVLSSTIEQFSKENPAGAGFFAFCSAFVFAWLVDVFKEAGSEVVEAVEKAEVGAFSSRRAFSLEVSAPPSVDVVEKTRKQVTQLLSERFPVGRGAEINDYADQQYLFRAEIYRNSLCACEVSARLKTFREITSSRKLRLTEDPTPYIGSLDVAIQRKSALRNFLATSAVFLVGSSGFLKLVGSDEGAGVAMVLSGLLLLGAIPLCIFSWDRMSRWFPPNHG
jgi:hypothetical protein